MKKQKTCHLIKRGLGRCLSECLQCKHEDLSLKLRTDEKDCNLSIVKAETGSFLECGDKLVQMNRCKRPCFKN